MKDKTIIIVDDEAGIRQLVRDFLSRYHFTIKEASCGAELFTLLETCIPDLIVLDLMLPDQYGIDICKEIRKTSNVPIIMLTAVQGDMNTVLGFEAGADDYIEKPFSAHVLLSRIQAILKRTQDNREASPSETLAETAPRSYSKARFSQWTYLPGEGVIQSNSGKMVFLTKNECQLLQLFLEHEEEILSRDKIAQALMLDVEGTLSRAIDVQVSRLRSKLKDKTQNNLIKSIRNKGYLLAVPVRFS